MEALERYDLLVDKYLRQARRNNLTPRTLTNYESTTRCFRDFLQKEIASGKIDGEGGFVTFEDIEAWIDYMTDTLNNKPSTVKQRLVTLGQFFTFATKNYVPDELRYAESPVSSDFMPKTPDEPIPEILPDEAIIKLWSYKKQYRASDAQFARNYALTVLVLTTGIRNMEVRNLRLSDVNFSEREILVTNAKGRKTRIVDMPGLCVLALENYLASGARPATLSDDDYLFGTTAAHEFGSGSKKQEKWHQGSTAWLSQLIERHVQRQTGYSNCRSHDCRHLFARINLNATGNLAELQGAMGHNSPLVTERYSGRLLQRRKRDSAKAVLAARDAAAEELKQKTNKIVTLYA